MIDVKKLRDRDVGRTVEYLPTKQQGKLKHWNKQAVFVVFNCDNQWYRFEQFTAEAVAPEDAVFVRQPRGLIK